MLNKNLSKILFIVHEASFTGAPILLLNLLQLLKQDEKIKFRLIIIRGGPLEKYFEETTSCIVLKKEGYTHLKKGGKWLRYFLLNKINTIRMFYAAFKSDLIFGNSIAASSVMKSLYFTGKPIIAYVHELEKVMDEYNSLNRGINLLGEKPLFLYPGSIVQKTLELKYQVPANHLKKLNYYIPFNIEKNKPNVLSNLKRQWKINENNFVIGCVGNASLRKGTDIFIEVAKLVCEKNSNARFIWIGGFETTELEKQWKQKVIEYGLQERFTFTGAQQPAVMKEVYPVLNLLFLSSREDPYPMVVLEAAWNKLPSVIFKESGGIIEFVSDDAGWTINNFSDVEAAQKILDIACNKNDLLEKAAKAKERVMAWHVNPRLILSQFYDAINCRQSL